MEEKLRKWFKKQPMWLQEAAKRLIEKGKLKDEDYKKLYEYCLNEAKQQIKKINIDIPISRLFVHGKSDGAIQLKSIGNIKGINALSPRSPLNFGNKSLVIIYGSNRSGKSGYVRILKHICGTKTELPLFSNVYKPFESEQKCTIEYQKGSELKKQEWSVSEKPINDLMCVDIFDSEFAMSYVTSEKEVTYEPQVLSFFSRLVYICESISSEIQIEIDKKPSKKPSCPLEYDMTEGAKWYKEGLSPDTTEESLNSYCSWTEDNKKELTELHKRIAQEDPEKEAKEIREKNKHLRELVDYTTKLLGSLSDQKCIEINELKEKYVQAKKTAKLVTDQAFKSTPLEGVGSEVWKQLWYYAKEYSEKKAYKGQPFPVISDDALCVLCHQKLDENTKTRFKSFDDFIKGKAQKAIEDTKKLLDNATENLPKIPAQEHLKTKLDAIDLQSDNTRLKNLYSKLEERKNQLSDSEIQTNFTPLPSIEEWSKEAEKIIIDNEQKAKQYEEDAEGINRGNLLSKQKELKMREWLSQQVTSIKEEIMRLKHIEVLKSARTLTNTGSLSNKKSGLSEELITEDFVKRFNAELKKLKANQIKVEIFKSRVKKGRALHQIRLKGTVSQNIKAMNILSEGEFRIVALSVFLADVTGGQFSTPFVFDDPISSLDQNFEEAVAHRLVQLSKERQVIVFTHRLSLLSLLEEYAKKDNIEPYTVCVKAEYWGTGEPGDIPLFIKKPDKALKDLINQLPEAKTILENQGKDAYEKFVKSLCSNFRIIIENVIESVLLTDIVKRHRRKIHSQNVKDLTKISNSDCKFIDDLMTKYSSFLHSASDETPINLPEPDELEKDFKLLQKWIKEFRKRKITVENK